MEEVNAEHGIVLRHGNPNKRACDTKCTKLDVEVRDNFMDCIPGTIR